MTESTRKGMQAAIEARVAAEKAEKAARAGLARLRGMRALQAIPAANDVHPDVSAHPTTEEN